MNKKFLCFLTSLIVFIILVGCKTEKYGSPINKNVPTIKIKEIMLNKSSIGQTVNLEGIIITQCQSKGCWFFFER
ncbi:hypothetical protein [Thermodesulfovibrio sp. N1]|uniref:hypothetical protein n=1 Tax=Thermodesulfovibrio sp. N1 TaxID=1871110 RepID=UPI00083A7762|nr:hypothetical protein [Thermodesulfovibrio sp. N1]